MGTFSLGTNHALSVFNVFIQFCKFAESLSFKLYGILVGSDATIEQFYISLAIFCTLVGKILTSLV